MLGQRSERGDRQEQQRADDHDRAEQQAAEGQRVVAQRSQAERRRFLRAEASPPSRSAR